MFRVIKRGYSTLEMQLIRNTAIENGYEKVFTRKIFELLYTNIYLKSILNRRKNFKWSESIYTFKNRIAYCYLVSVKTFIGYGENLFIQKDLIEFHKLLEPMNKKNKYKFTYENIIEFVSREELFVFVIGLSKIRVTAEILYK